MNDHLHNPYENPSFVEGAQAPLSTDEYLLDRYDLLSSATMPLSLRDDREELYEDSSRRQLTLEEEYPPHPDPCSVPPPLVPLNDYEGAAANDAFNSDSSASYQTEPMCLSFNRDREEYEDHQSGPFQEKHKKRMQLCRLCANHDLEQLMRGHKHFCKYRNCNCPSCRITKNRQHFMKEQQRMTRRHDKEKLQQKGQPNMGLVAGPSREAAPNCEYPEYRKMEMAKDLAYVENNFQEDEVCKLYKKEQKKKNKKST